MDLRQQPQCICFYRAIAAFAGEIDRGVEVAETRVRSSQHALPQHRAGAGGAEPLMSQRAVDPAQIVLQHAYRLPEVAAPHIGLAEIEARPDVHRTVADLAGD